MSKKQGGILLSDKGRIRLKSLRKESPLTDEEIAKLIGYEPQQLYNFVCKGRSQRKIFPPTLKTFATIFGVSEAYILGETDYRTEREERAVRMMQSEDTDLVTKSPIFSLLCQAGYVLEDVRWEPYCGRNPEDCLDYHETRTVEEIANAIEKYLSNVSLDRGPVFTFRTPTGSRVYVPVENFAATETMIIGISKTIFKNTFEDWIGVEAVTKPLPEEWKLPITENKACPSLVDPGSH